MDLKHHLIRQMAFSIPTFGPGRRTIGVLEHIKEEVEEVKKSNGSSSEWVDLVLLSLDGLTRQLAFANKEDRMTNTKDEIATIACNMIRGKQDCNENRQWPDWRLGSLDKPINHVRVGKYPKHFGNVSIIQYDEHVFVWMDETGGPAGVAMTRDMAEADQVRYCRSLGLIDD